MQTSRPSDLSIFAIDFSSFFDHERTSFFPCDRRRSWLQHSNLVQIQHAINLVLVPVLLAPRRTIAVVVVKWPIGVVTRKNVEDVQILDVISRVPAHVLHVERWDIAVVHVKLRIRCITRKNVQDICARWVWPTSRKLKDLIGKETGHNHFVTQTLL